MSLSNPLMLFLLLPLGFAAWRLLRRGRRSGIRFSATSRLPAKMAGWRAKLASLTPLILLAGLCLLIVAAARPRTPLAHNKKSVDAIAIVMTVDVSGSMSEPDLAPEGTDLDNPSKRLEWTRLAVVKRFFAEFVEKRPDDLIGLVSFGTYSAGPTPLTMDHEFLLHVLKGVKIPDYDDENDTSIGDGLATAVRMLKDAKPKSKIVILLSDGIDSGLPGSVTPDEATAAAAKMGVKVYAIGIGTKPRIMGYDILGRPIWSAPMDERQLRSIAAKTGGTYFPVNDRDSLGKALAEIDQLETTKIDADVYDRWDEHFAAFLFAGAVLVFLAVSLSMFASRRLA